MLANRRAKIVATMGPAVQDIETLKKVIQSGVNVARLNFSHGTHEDHAKMIENLRNISREFQAPIGILQDLQGPKIRVSRFDGGAMQLVAGQSYRMVPGLEQGTEDQIGIDFPQLPDVVRVGQKILLDDGMLEVTVEAVIGSEVQVKVVHGGTLKDRKGVNIPGASLPIDSLTQKDREDLEFGLEQGVDFIALSFVRRAGDLRELRERIEETNSHARVIAKIEMLEAIENLEEIVRSSDGIMVARGDLAVEVGQTQLTGLQKRIIRLCNLWGRPVITATQMLESMTKSPRPTRAEITDISNAVIDGSDALMLSAESASGQFPVESVRTMHEIITEVEKDVKYYQLNLDDELFSIPAGIGASASICALKLDAKAIVCMSTTGRTAAIISRFRPKARLISVTHESNILSRLELNWGVQTLKISPYSNTEEAMAQVETQLLDFGLVKPGDRIILTLGLPVESAAKTNSLRVYSIEGRDEHRATESKERPLRYQD